MPNVEVLAIGLPDLDEKDALLARNEKILFPSHTTTAFPAVLVRLRAVRVSELRPLMRGGLRKRRGPSFVPPMQMSCRFTDHGAQGRNRTTDTGIFRADPVTRNPRVFAQVRVHSALL